ncbi:MAG: rhodanese-related sulfurtransferase [Woeseiaceae bacterium]|nr:rhodanese-related sulfurtransferase [Woeseiaceae bacterium]
MNVVSFYRFTDVADPGQLRNELQQLCDEQDLLGTVLVAPEGINGTLAGEAGAVSAILGWLGDYLSLASPLDGRWTDADEAPFHRMRVRLKKEIVALGRPDIRPDRAPSRQLSPAEWNEVISNPETLVIDTRNHYEVEVGTFPGAIDPQTDSFRQFQDFASGIAELGKERPVAMFCTGGIRCEKAAALMNQLGFDEVYQLAGGILNYLENVRDEENLWQGECFVFDKRVAVDRDLAEGGYVQCHACRRPLSTEDIASPDYREGVSCPRCIDTLDESRQSRLEERRRQVELARERKVEHIGAKID